MNKLLKLLLALPLVLLCCTLTACGDDNDNDNDFDIDIENGSSDGGSTSEYAPSSMVGKIIRWDESNTDGTAGNSNVRVKFDNQTDMRTNFSDWCTYTYKKKSANTAHLNFMAPQTMAGVVRTFQYDFDLIFTGSTEFNVSGTLIVNYLSGPNVGSTVYHKFTGKGKYVDDLWGKDPISPGSEADIAKFAGTWKEKDPESSMATTYYTFHSDGTYTYSLLWLPHELGNFRCSSSSISLYKDYDYIKTLYLEGNILKDRTTGKSYTKE